MRDEDALGVHAVQDLPEPVALLADQAVGRDGHVVHEHLGRRVVDHGLERLDAIPFLRASWMSTRNTERPWVFFSTSSIGVVRASSSIRSECSALEIQTFWPRQQVAVAVADGAGLELRGVRAARGLGHAEGLQPQLAARDPRQVCRASAPGCRGGAASPSVYICAWQAAA